MLLETFGLIITPTRRVGGTRLTAALHPYFIESAHSERFNLGVLSGSEYGRRCPIHGNWEAEVSGGPYRSFHKVLMGRNPFDKLVSGYEALTALGRLGGLSFTEFVHQRERFRPTSDDIW